ncbi:hypothetical protein SETIT_9G264600v2 [Setaria italica]|uniref:BTB domain-containing protein n=2 Tax=Setaria italica TaxID=4555 RepID=A0A368SKZ1_SETIT|nr:hypothetical protein SETIT_9G264600v2 [Setaria italica]
MPATTMATEPSGSSSSIVASMVTGHHLLHIDGYSHTKELAPNGRCIRSRSFRAAGHSWHIGYYPNGLLRSGADHIAVYLYHERHAGEPAVKARAKLSLLDQAGEPVLSCTRTNYYMPSNVWGFYNFVRRAALEASPHLLKDDGFTIRCDIFVYTEDAVAATPPSDLPRHLGGLLRRGTARTVAGETFRAHRCVLAARSPVFKAELLGTMREGDRDPAAVVEVDDMDAEAFRVLLEFAYTDALPETMSPEEEAAMCQHLLVAADRYDMERLKMICEARLRKHIDAGSAATILALAELHGCPGLKDACFRFLETPRAMAAVAEAEGFEHLSRICPSTLKELVFRIIDR